MRTPVPRDTMGSSTPPTAQSHARDSRRRHSGRRHAVNMLMNKQVLLASRPTGAPAADNFRLVETPVPEPADGQVLVRHRFLSLDPYMRGRMNAGRSYTRPQALGEVMGGATAGEVLNSKHSDFHAGEERGAQEGDLCGRDIMSCMPGFRSHCMTERKARASLISWISSMESTKSPAPSIVPTARLRGLADASQTTPAVRQVG